MKTYVPDFSRLGLKAPGPDPRLSTGIEYLDGEMMAAEKIKRAIYDNYADDPMNEAVVKYWEAKGMKKELFDSEREGGRFAFSVFTPLTMKPDKKYALMYVCHGGDSPINLAETYGFNELGVAERFICCYPENGGRSNNDVDTEFPRIVAELQRMGYPIDMERIYLAGFSSGSEGAAAAACTCPRLVAAAAICPGGQPFGDLLFYTGKDYYASTEGLRIPACFVGGTVDGANFPSPSCLDPEKKPHGYENLDIWMREIAQVRDPERITRESVWELLRNGDTEAKREFGLNFHKEFSLYVEGLSWTGGDFYGADGAPVMRYARAKGARHAMWDSQINIVWDYLKHFRRDTETGESVYDLVACWGER